MTYEESENNSSEINGGKFVMPEPPFEIVSSRGDEGAYDVLGMRADRANPKKKGFWNILTVENPGDPGWLGNNFIAKDARGTFSREEASSRFIESVERRARSDAWREAFWSLIGKRVGYYKPSEKHSHLKALQQWLRQNPPPANWRKPGDLKNKGPLEVEVPAGLEVAFSMEVGKRQEEKEQASQLTDAERDALKKKRAVDDRRLEGITRVRSEDHLPEEFRHWGDKVVPAYVIPWKCVSGRIVPQLQPDKAPTDKNGRPCKYIFPKGCGGLVGVMPGSEELVKDATVPLIVVEGTYQGRAVATALSGSGSPYAVVNVSGCNGWSTDQAPSPEFTSIPLKGREVFCLFDADFKTNFAVYEGAKFLSQHLLDEYLAASVQFVTIPGRGKDGADDVLSRHEAGHNQEMVLRWIDKARGKDGALPGKAPRKPRRNLLFFDPQGGLMPLSLWEHLQQEFHLALNGDKSIAVYENGVYKNSDSRRWNKAVEDLLRNDFHPSYLATVSEIGHTNLKVEGS